MPTDQARTSREKGVNELTDIIKAVANEALNMSEKGRSRIVTAIKRWPEQ